MDIRNSIQNRQHFLSLMAASTAALAAGCAGGTPASPQSASALPRTIGLKRDLVAYFPSPWQARLIETNDSSGGLFILAANGNPVYQVYHANGHLTGQAPLYGAPTTKIAAPPRSMSPGQVASLGSGYSVTAESATSNTLWGDGSSNTGHVFAGQYVNFVSDILKSEFGIGMINTAATSPSVSPNNAASCGLAQLALTAATFALVVAFAASVGEAGVNPLADAGLWAAIGAYATAYAAFINECAQ